MFKAAVAVASVVACLAPGAAGAGEASGTRINYAPGADLSRAAGGIEQQPASAAGGDTLVFSAPPRELPAAANEIYEPIAQYLSGVLGKKVTYRHSNNWLTYQTEMRKGTYDLVFDGPHFNGWRAANLSHNILAKLPGDHVFVVITRSDGNSINDIKQLSGRAVCAMPPPNLGTLTLLSQFDNPARQPVIANTDGWENIYRNVMARRCTAGVLPLTLLEKFGQGGVKIVFKGKALPNQAFSAGPRVTLAEQAKIASALTAPESAAAFARLREHYAVIGNLTLATRDEYLTFATLLKGQWGYAN